MCCRTRISNAVAVRPLVTDAAPNVTSEASRDRLSYAACSRVTMISAGFEPATSDPVGGHRYY